MTTVHYDKHGNILPTAWSIFYNSGFKHRPARAKFKTNKAKWAKK